MIGGDEHIIFHLHYTGLLIVSDYARAKASGLCLISKDVRFSVYTLNHLNQNAILCIIWRPFQRWAVGGTSPPTVFNFTSKILFISCLSMHIFWSRNTFYVNLSILNKVSWSARKVALHTFAYTFEKQACRFIYMYI